MKQGSADDPFADDGNDGSTRGTDDASVDAEQGFESETDDHRTAEGSDSESRPSGNAGAADDPKTLPYIYARDSVKDGRQQRPIFLRDEIENGIPELVAELEAAFGEDVYRTDVLEAAVVVAQQNPRLVEEELEEWGYGWN